ncbi:MAG: GNAT family N-acetyltransferase [Chitinophagales bacterium]|nr:GNAT family N-acetyltransferase [Chitinophagales bacterium]
MREIFTFSNVTNSTINIRTATPRDAEQIAFVHIDSWRTTYRSIVSDNFLDNLNGQTKSNFWESVLTTKSDNVFVAESDGEIIGFAAGGQSRDKNNFDSELYAIYVLQQHQHKNIGRLLLTATAKYLQTSGHSSLYVWVLADNNSRTFYERLGGELFDSKEIEIGGQQMTEIAYGWSELSKLIESVDGQTKKKPSH